MKIETDVPLPERWPFRELKPGNSFIVAYRYEDSVQRRRRRQAAWGAAKRFMAKHPAIKLIVRRDPEWNFRCWRVE